MFIRSLSKSQLPHIGIMPDATSMLAEINFNQDHLKKILEEHLQRIHLWHNLINATTEILEDDLQLPNHHSQSQLYGIPINVKESIAIAGRTITAGSLTSNPIFCQHDAEVIQSLKKAGAVIIARSNTPEYSIGPETGNLLTGKTFNPLNLAYSVGGSSGGAAALVATGGSSVGIGTDFGGSIRIPSSFCGLVGFKPASSAISKSGIYPPIKGFADSLYAVGTISRSVRDAALVYNVIAKINTNIPSEIDPSIFTIYHSTQLEKSIQDPIVTRSINATIELLKHNGCNIKTFPKLAKGTLFHDFNVLIADGLNDYIREKLSNQQQNHFNIFEELWRQFRNKPSIHSHLFQAMLGWSVVKPNPKRLNQAIARTKELRIQTNYILGKSSFLLLPTVGILPPRYGSLIRKSWRPGVAKALQSCVFCNMADLPAITIPAKTFTEKSTGRVPGIMIVGTEGNETALLSLAEWLEKRIYLKQLNII